MNRIQINQNGNYYEIKFKYDPTLVAMIKQIPGKEWNPSEKLWRIHKDKLGMLLNMLKGSKYADAYELQSNEQIGENAEIEPTTTIPNVDLTGIKLFVEDGSKLYPHQLDFMKYAIDRQRKGYRSGFLCADDPGCIDGDATIRIKEPGKAWTRDTKLSNAYKLFSDGHVFKVKCMVNDRFQYMPIKYVLDRGNRSVVKVTFESGYIICTPDHEIYTENGWVPAESLSTGDTIFTNGDPERCINCGSTENIIQSSDATYKGYCRRCMYKFRKCGVLDDDVVVKTVDEDGYVRLKGRPTRLWPLHDKSNGMGIYEHHQVWYEHTGHIIDTKTEAIHHINHIKTDNRFENLKLLSISEHAKLHADMSTNHLPQFQDRDFYYCHGVKIWCVPHSEAVLSVETFGTKHVYDIVIDSDDIHNFIANNVVVHNCGKTLESINYAMYNKLYNRYKHCLVICNVNTSKYNWQDDIRKHTNGKMSGYILGSRKRKHPKPGQATYIVGSSQNKLDDLLCGHMYEDDTEPELPYFIILNVEAIRMKVGKRYPIADKIIDMINDGELNMIIIDEVHKNMSPTSLQGKQILRIKDKTHSRCTWVSLTGTPIVNKPTDVFLPMRLIDAHNFTSYYKWCQYFCVYGGYGGHEVIAYRNIPRLKFMLQQNMIRRRKEDVLNLPDKIHMDVYVENTKYQSRLAEEVTMDLIAHAEEIANDLNPMVRFLRLRQVNGSPELVDHDLRVDNTYLKYNAKLVKLLELLEEIHERGEKTVIFSNWVEPLRTLFKFLSSKYKVCCFTGTMSEAERQKHKRVFMNNPEYTVMIGTIGALGTTHTLTAANNIIFYDEPWTYADKLQAEDRCHRISAKKSVNVYTLISKDTIDERVHDIVYSKKDTSDYLVDNKLDFKNNPNLVATLLGKDI